MVEPDERPNNRTQILERLDTARDSALHHGHNMRCLTNILVHRMEAEFDLDRAKVSDNNVTLMFQREGIEATMWTVGELFSAARHAFLAIDALHDGIEELLEAEIEGRR